jgi:phosphotransferase system enzyme I (PtsI)
MIRRKGVGASRGIAIGPAHLTEVPVSITERRILRSDREVELARLEAAVSDSERQLDRLHGKLEAAPGSAGHELIDLHRLILRSPELNGEAQRLINEECFAAEWALTRALEHIRAVFARLDDSYFRDRGGDFDAVGDRLLRVLLGLPELRPEADARGAIAVGVDMSPLDLFALQRAGIAALVSESGGATSHAGIVARAFGLPYVVGVRQMAGRVKPGTPLIVDGTRGEVIVDPDDDALRVYRARAGVQRDRERQLKTTRSLPSVTTDGIKIHLGANVESMAGVSAAVAAGAESIGLFRTEFLYLERADLPSEQEQYQDAVAALRAAEGLPVTFRTLDLGGDKLPLALKIPVGPNPALGIRSARFSLHRPDILKRQLRALYRASSVGPLRYMFPLVSGVKELQRLRQVCDEVRAELGDEKVLHDPATPLGIMIETPSAALTADHLARHCDFLSVGTNDLIQYAFAADRENDDVAHLHQPLHPAVLRTLKSLVEMAQAARVPISICGDMAGDPFLTWILIGLGFRELSMDRDRIPLVKGIVRGSSVAEAEALVREALALEDESQVGELLRSKLEDRFPIEVEGFIPSERAG